MMLFDNTYLILILIKYLWYYGSLITTNVVGVFIKLLLLYSSMNFSVQENLVTLRKVSLLQSFPF